MMLHIPHDASFDAKKFLIYNIIVALLVPLISVFTSAGTYIIGLILGVLAIIGLVVFLFFTAGPLIAVIVLGIVFLIFGGTLAGLNVIFEGMEATVAFLTNAIPSVICLFLGIAMLGNAKIFKNKQTVVLAYVTAAAYLVSIILYIYSGFQMAFDGVQGAGSNDTYLYGMVAAMGCRILYTAFGYKEKKEG